MWQIKARTDHILETHSRGLVAALYQNGTFVHTTGEVSYLYDCRPVVVEALDTDCCYNNLAVNPVNDTVYFAPLGRTLSNNQTGSSHDDHLYLSPGSCILTPFAVEWQCLPLLPQKWKSLHVVL